MFERRSLRWPITLGVLMIVLTVALTVGWVLMSINAASSSEQPSVYWTLLAVGSAFLALILTGVVTYLTLTIKSVNLTVRQSNFIDSVTHELKSPIASLKLYLQTMNRRSVTAEKREQFLRAMLEDVERLDQLITHLLEAGRVEKENVAGDQ
ncbi:MAG: sensor histidine kinase, partial [Planctomycetales bacterium]|nr:sensor histidine kinase [Planctomycetales bacterium]